MGVNSVQTLALKVLPDVDKLHEHYYEMMLQYSQRREDKAFQEEFATVQKAVAFVFDSPYFQRLIDEREKLRINQRARVKRLRARIEELLTGGTCWFVTLTFSDSVLLSTNQESRRSYVSRFLRGVGLYVGNIDFGSKNGREHYHAVVQAENPDFSEWEKYGFFCSKKVRCGGKSALRLAKYVAKLTNHAIKESAGNTRIIYGYHVRQSSASPLDPESFSPVQAEDLPF